MTDKHADLESLGGGLAFRIRLGSGHELIVDDSAGDTGCRPAELLVGALAGCTAMDVISILRKKRQRVDRYALEACGHQVDDWPHAFDRFVVTHVVEGAAIDDDAVARAIELSATKYCSVGATVASGAAVITHRARIRDEQGTREAEVVSVGPAGAVGGPVAEPVRA